MAEQQTPPAENTEQKQGDPDELGENGKKALEAERKRADEAARKVKDLEAQITAQKDSTLTETQKLQKQLEDLNSKYEAAQLASTRDRVAVSEQIPEGLVGHMTGENEEQLRSSAKALKAAIAEAAKPGTPAPDPSQGAHGAVGGGADAEMREFTRNLFSNPD